MTDNKAKIHDLERKRDLLDRQVHEKESQLTQIRAEEAKENSEFEQARRKHDETLRREEGKETQTHTELTKLQAERERIVGEINRLSQEERTGSGR
jgi:hypothetical protein